MSSSEPSTPDPLSPTAPPADRRWGIILLWLLPALALLLVFVYGFLTREPADLGDTAPRIGKPLADFTLPDLQGHAVQLAALRGKVVFVNVWATWCPPCRKEMPDLQALYDKYKDQGFVVLAISDEEMAKVAPFIGQRGISYPVLLDPGRKVNEEFMVEGIPKSFVYDREGKLVAQSIDMRTRGQFQQMLAQAGLQ